MLRFLLLIFLSLPLTCCFSKKSQERTIKTRPAAYVTEEEEETPGQHFLARFDGVKYPKDFKNFFYVNPHAPKGGTLRMATVGTFDKVNYFLLKGLAVAELTIQFDRLMCEALDEPYSKYGLVIKTCEVAPDASWVKFHIRSQARFHDGTPVTAESIEKTIMALQRDGVLPVFKSIYSRIKKIESQDEHTLILHFNPDKNGNFDRLTPLIMANIMPIARKSLADLADNVLTPVIGSGPYMIKGFELGQSLHFTKTPDYWAENLPVSRGKWNFDDVKITYFKNDRALVEAFKKGDFDVLFITDRQQFDTFQCPDQRFTKLDFKHKRPVHVQTIALNQNSAILKDQRVRDALNLTLSFKDINHVCFSNAALHARSLFENTGLGHKGTPEDREKNIWLSLKATAKIDDTFFDRLMNFDVNYFTKGTKEERLKKAEILLEEAGYVYDKNLECRAKSSDEKLEFDLIMRQSKAKFSRFLTVFKGDLEKIGIKLNIVMLEESMYRQREDAGYYDMMMMPYTLGMSPGIELMGFFGKMAGSQKGSSNYMNLIDDVAEELIAGAMNSKDQASLQAYIKALDRYLCMRGYMILLDYNNSLMMVYRNDRIDFPKNPHADINVWERGWSVA